MIILHCPQLGLRVGNLGTLALQCKSHPANEDDSEEPLGSIVQGVKAFEILDIGRIEDWPTHSS